MEQFYQRAFRISNNAQKLTDELFKYNPLIINDNTKKALSILAGMARALEEDYSQMWTDLIKRHEKEQVNDRLANNPKGL